MTWNGCYSLEKNLPKLYFQTYFALVFLSTGMLDTQKLKNETHLVCCRKISQTVLCYEQSEVKEFLYGTLLPLQTAKKFM